MNTQEKLNYIGKKYVLNPGSLDETHVTIMDIRVVYGCTDVLVKNENGMQGWRKFYAAQTVGGNNPLDKMTPNQPSFVKSSASKAGETSRNPGFQRVSF